MSHSQQLANQHMEEMASINNSYVSPQHAGAASRFAQAQQDVRDYKQLGQGMGKHGNPAN